MIYNYVIGEDFMRFKVNEETCIGCGACQAICSDVFEITDDGIANAKDVEVNDEKIKEEAIDAMEGCPTGAISELKKEN